MSRIFTKIVENEYKTKVYFLGIPVWKVYFIGSLVKFYFLGIHLLSVNNKRPTAQIQAQPQDQLVKTQLLQIKALEVIRTKKNASYER